MTRTRSWARAGRLRTPAQAKWLANALALFLEGGHPALFGRRPQESNREFFVLWMQTNVVASAQPDESSDSPASTPPREKPSPARSHARR